MKFDPTKPVMFRSCAERTDLKIVLVTDSNIVISYKLNGETHASLRGLDGMFADNQCDTDLINIPEKKVAREVWVNEFKSELAAYLYLTEESAKDNSVRGCTGQIKLREVLEDDEPVQVGWKGIPTPYAFYQLNEYPLEVTRERGFIPIYSRKGDMK